MNEKKKITINKIVAEILKYILFLVSFMIIILLIYHFIYVYTPYLKNGFGSYNNFEEFLYQFPYEKQNILLMIIFSNLRIFFLADSFFIIVGIMFILSVKLGLFLNKLFKSYLENKKGGGKK